MFYKFRVVFFVLITMIFSLSLAHAESDNAKKNRNYFLRSIGLLQKKKLKDKKTFRLHPQDQALRSHRQENPLERKFQTALINSNDKVFSEEKPIALPPVMYRPPLICDMGFTELEVESKIIKSDYGCKIIGHLQNILDNFKNIYQDTMGDLESDTELYFDSFFPYTFVEENVAIVFEDFENLLLIQTYLSRGDVNLAEDIFSQMQSTWVKNMALESIFDEYLIKNDMQGAQRMYSMMDFDLDDEDEEDAFSEITDTFILALLRNNDFKKAEELAMKNTDEFYREDDLCVIVKYYTRIGDIDNAKRIVEKISQYYAKRRANLYIADYYAREKKVQDFQKLVFSSNDSEFISSANFIMNIYQKDFAEAEKNKPYDYEAPLYNIAEILVSLNRVSEAEYLIKYFGDDWDVKDVQMFFVNAYLKNAQVDEAKRVRDEIEDAVNKIIASKLIIAFIKG